MGKRDLILILIANRCPRSSPAPHPKGACIDDLLPAGSALFLWKCTQRKRGILELSSWGISTSGSLAADRQLAFLVMILEFHVDDLVWGESCHLLVPFGCSAAHPLQHTYDRAPGLHGVCSSLVASYMNGCFLSSAPCNAPPLYS